MSILARIGRILTGKANEAVDKAEANNAGVVAEQIVREMDEKIDRANDALIKTMAQLELVRADQDDAEKAVAKWENNVLLASEKGDETLVNECVAKLQAAEESFAALTAQEKEMEETATTFKKQVDDLLKERNKAASTARNIGTQVQIARAQKTVADAIKGADVSGATSSMAKLQQSVNRTAAEGKAAMARAKETNGTDLNDKLAALNAESSSDVVARLKAKKAQQ